MLVNLAIQLLGCLEYIMIIYFLNSKFKAKYTFKFQTAISFFVMFGFTLLFANTNTMPVFVQPLPLTLMFFLYLRILRVGEWKSEILFSVLSTIFLLLSSILAIILTKLFFNVNAYYVSEEPRAVQIQILILAKLIQASVFFIISQKRVRLSSLSLASTLILFSIPLVSSAMIMSFLYYTIRLDYRDNTVYLLLINSIGILLINIGIFVLYHQLSLQNYKIFEQSALLNQYEMNKAHYEEVSTLYKEIRGWRHDFNNHVQVIEGLLDIGDIEQAKQYIKAMDSSSVRIEQVIYSGNELIDAILNSKVTRANADGIRMIIEIKIPSKIHMDNTDLCSLLSNLLDNSIEACQRIHDKTIVPYIYLSMQYVKNQLTIHVENSSGSYFKKQGNKYLTVKKSLNHGIGLQQIDRIVGSYNGFIEREFNQSIFITIISIPLT